MNTTVLKLTLPSIVAACLGFACGDPAPDLDPDGADDQSPGGTPGDGEPGGGAPGEGGGASGVSADGACFTLVRGEEAAVQLIEITESAWRPVAEFGDVPGLHGVAGLARRGDKLVIAAELEEATRWVEFDVPRNETTIGAETNSASAAADDAAYYAYCGDLGSDNVCRYSDFAALNRGGTDDVLGELPTTSGLAMSGNALYGAWHSTDRLLRLDLSSGTVTRLDLTGHDGWVLGFDVAGDKAFLLTSDNSAPRSAPIVLQFDAITGQFDGVMSRASDHDGAPRFVIGGLYCDEAGEEPIVVL